MRSIGICSKFQYDLRPRVRIERVVADVADHADDLEPGRLRSGAAPTRKRLPMALSPGHINLAMRSSMRPTGVDCAVSRASKARPSSTGMPIALK